MNNDTSRRRFLKSSALSGLALGAAAAHASMLPGEVDEAQAQPAKRPNIVLYCCDQCHCQLKNPQIASLENSPGCGGLRGCGRMRRRAQPGAASSRADAPGGYASSFPGGFAATTPAFFLSLSR